MTDSGGKKVVFRIAGVGFSLAVDSLMEINEAGADDVDSSSADPEQGIIGLLSFRDDAIRVLDVRKLLDLPSADDDAVLMVVFGTDGAWAFPIEKLDGVAQADEFRPCDLPALLLKSDRRPFAKIDIWRNEPLVCFEPALIEQLQVST